MKIAEPEFSFGIEEEYLLVDRKSRDLIRTMPKAMFAGTPPVKCSAAAITTPPSSGPS